MSIKPLPRRFVINDITLDDPVPLGTLDDVLESLTQSHPNLRHTKIFDSDAKISPCGEYIDFNVCFPPVKTDG